MNAGSRTAWLVIAVSLAASLVALGAGGALILYRSSNPDERAATAGPVDIGFAQDMGAHHSQAIEMAQIMTAAGRSSTASPDDHATVMALASQIEVAQLNELGRLQGFLLLWNAPTAPAGPAMTWMATVDGSHPGSKHVRPVSQGLGIAPDAEGAATMGMATQGQLQRLRMATGKERDLLFLQLMLRHHLAGSAMASYAAERASVSAVRAMAASTAYEQQAEINLIVRLLIKHGVDPKIAPPP